MLEAHLLRMNDWMNTHDFPEDVKVQRFCLTLTGEARLWYASLEPIVMTLQELQNQFRQQYSKLVNTREQLFHVWIECRDARYICDKNKAGSKIIRLWSTTGVRSV